MKKKVIPAIIIIALIFIMGGIYALQIVYQHYSYSTEKADLNAYFDIKSDSDVAIILGDEREHIYLMALIIWILNLFKSI